MTHPIYSSPPALDSRAAELRPADTYPSGDETRAAAAGLGLPSSSDTTSLSLVAGQSLNSDSARIESLRQQFQQGAYQVDAAKVSEQILKLQFPSDE